MNVNFEYSKNLACEGSILMWLSLIPYVGPILAIIGLILLMRSLKEFSGYYQDENIYSQALTGIKYYIVAVVAVAVSIGAMAAGIWSATNGFTPDFFNFTASFGVGLIAFFASLGVAFVFFVLASVHLRVSFNALADHSGESSFRTAGTLLFIGSLLTLILVGLVLMPIAWILATIGFFTMKPRQYQQYNTQPYSYPTPPTPPSTTPPNGTQV